MPTPLQLPAGYSQRPLRLSDAAAVTEVIAADEKVSLGEAIIEEADIVAEWQRPSYDLEANTVGVHDSDGRLVAMSELTGGTRGFAVVHPDHCGRGLGTEVARWMRERARETGADEIGMSVPHGSPGDRLLKELGYRIRWTSWVLELLEGAAIPERALPEGYAVRAATEADHVQAWTVIEDSFLEWSVRERESFEDWQAGVPQRPGFEPWNLRVVTDPGGEVVAVAFIHNSGEGDTKSAFVDRLATRKDQRGRGLAQALLVDSFAAARAHGALRSELSTDSRTGALGLYEKVGMVVTSTWNSRAISI